MINLIDIKKTYVLPKGKQQVHALRGVNLSLPDKGLIGIVGVSGCGKTTFLNLIGGIDKPTSGKIEFDNNDLGTFSNKELDEFRSKNIGFIFQDYNLIKELNVFENVLLGLQIKGVPKIQAKEKVNDALSKVDISDLANRRIDTLSGGQQQRVAIARAIAKEPNILLCDEPTGNLDSETTKEIVKILKKISETTLVLMVTHNEKIANEFADQVLIMSDGKIAKQLSLVKDEEKKVEKKIFKKRRGKLSFSYMSKLMLLNLWNTKLSSIISIILLTVLFSLAGSIYSLTFYNKNDAYMQTFKTNEQYVIGITKYLENKTTTYDPYSPTGFSYVGPQIFYEDVVEEDIDELNALVDNKLNFYKSHFFKKNFQDFFDDNNRFIEGTTRSFLNHPSSFTEAIAVPNFLTFLQPLKEGKLPENVNEVLVYDYVADALLYWDVLQGNSVVGQMLTDNISGFSMKIVGVLKSNYKSYENIVNDDEWYNDYYKIIYLSSLQAIFCMPEFINVIKESAIYSSFVSMKFFNEEENPAELQNFSKIAKKGEYDLLNELNWAFHFDEIESNSEGWIISKEQAMQITGLDETEFDSESFGTEFVGCEAFINAYIVDGEEWWYTKSIDPPLISSTLSYYILGIVNEFPDGDTDNLPYYVNDSFYDLYNGCFKQFYLGLSNNWNLNAEQFAKFSLPDERTFEFYNTKPDGWEETGWTDYTYSTDLIKTADENYLPNIKNFAFDILIYIIIAVVIGVFYFAIATIRNNYYKIGVLKSLGASNFSITLIFSFSILFVTILSFILSIPISFVIMNAINFDFVSSIDPTLIFFSIKSLALLISFGIGIGVMLVAVAIPLIKLFMLSPAEAIKRNS